MSHSHFQDFKFASIQRDAPAPQRWGILWLRVGLFVVFGMLVGLLCRQAAAQSIVRTAVINDPASARSSDVRPLIRDDIETYLNGGRAALGWSMHLTTATQLAQAYRVNEFSAQKVYGDDADIIVKGTAQAVGVTLGRARIDMREGVTVFMKPGHTEWLASVKSGQRVEVACRRARTALGLVGAYDCEPRAAYVVRMVEWYFFSMHGLAQSGDKMAARLLQVASK